MSPLGVEIAAGRVAQTVRETLALHVADRHKTGGSYLFESSWKRPYSIRGVRALLARYATIAGLPHNMPPHRLRHFLLTWLKTQPTDVKMASQVIRTLEQKGLITRETRVTDTRARRLVVTATGAALAPRQSTPSRPSTARCLPRCRPKPVTPSPPR